MERLWEKLVNAADGDDEFALFLSFWMPPRYLVGCSQLVMHEQDGPVLLRNYDLDPTLNETTMLHTAWRRQRVMGMVEGLAGLADGMNESGLAASLAFGGRTVSGRGFGIPLILRYVLEMCRDARDARDALRSVPCHMSYNVTVADRSGGWATVFMAPDRPAIVSDKPFATNHQIGVEWPYYARLTRTKQRADFLDHLAASKTDAEATGAAFLQYPLFSCEYDRGFGTVYTASYHLGRGSARLSWRGGAQLDWHMANFKPQQRTISYEATGLQAGSRNSNTTYLEAEPAFPFPDGDLT